MALYTLACIVASYWGLRFYGDTGYLFRELLDPEFPAGAFTAASGGFLMWAAWNLLRLGSDQADRWAIGLGGCLLWLGLDEVAQIHERITAVLIAWNVPSPFGMEQDVLVFAAYGLALAPCLLGTLPRLRGNRQGLRLVWLAVALAAVSQGMDALPWHRLGHLEQQWVGAIEESAKTLATLAFALASGTLRNAR